VSKKKSPTKSAGRAAYLARYYAENIDRERERKRKWYLENREEIIARNSANQQQKNPIGPVYRVGIKRRYLIVDGRAHFNSRLGFSASELRSIAREIIASTAITPRK